MWQREEVVADFAAPFPCEDHRRESARVPQRSICEGFKVACLSARQPSACWLLPLRCTEPTLVCIASLALTAGRQQPQFLLCCCGSAYALAELAIQACERETSHFASGHARFVCDACASCIATLTELSTLSTLRLRVARAALCRASHSTQPEDAKRRGRERISDERFHR